MRMCNKEWFKFSDQSMKVVKTGPSGVWGIDKHNKLYTYVGDKWLHFMDDVQQIDPRIPSMIFGIQKSGVFCVPKIPNKLSLSSHRLNIMNVDFLTCTEETCWYLNKNQKEIHLYSYKAPCTQSNKEGQIKFQSHLKYIEANEKKQILALDSSGKVFFKKNSTTAWQRLDAPGKCQSVSYGDTSLWLVLKDGRLMACQKP
uniref:Uncharacterized protein n=1 Tax=Eptatretus burgeri TaxID=7764 RepID=A0A8C4PZA7_EPTBU